MKEYGCHRGWVRHGIKVLMLLALAICLVFVVVPNFVRPRVISAKNACVANLKQIEGAKATWALEHKQEPTDTPSASDLYGSTNYLPEAPACPQGGIYTIGSVGEKPRCSLAGPGHSL